MLLFWIGYITMALHTYRYTVGWIFADCGFENLKEGDIWFGFILIPILFGVFWPLMWPPRLTYVLCKKYFSDNPDLLATLFPAPGRVETARQKQERINQEQKAAIEQQQTTINAREAELGFELTRW